MFFAYPFIILFVCLLTGTGAFGQTNIEIFDNLLADSIFSELETHLGDDPFQFSLSRLDKDDRSNWYVEKEFLEFFPDSANGIVLVNDDLPCGNNERLSISYKPLDLTVEYYPASQNNVQRNVVERIYFRLMECMGHTVIWSGEITAHYNDSLKKKQVKFVESENLPFTVGVWKPSEKSMIFLPVAFVSAIAGSVVFLFFALRTQ